MELVLVRHALPLRREVVEGPADPELSAAGHDQSARLAEYLAAESIDAIYSSPLRRAMQTAEPLAQQIGTSILVVEALAEFDRMSNEYVPVEELRAANDPRWHKLLAGEWESNSETYEEFRSRVIAGIESVVVAHPSQRIVVVCHGGVINQYLANVLGISTQRGFFYPHYTSIHRVAASQQGERSLVTLNETAHLR